MDIGQVIETPSDLEEGVRFLCQVEPIFAQIYARTGPLPLRRKPEGFSQLVSAIVSQQVSTASAAAIWARVEAAGFAQADHVRAAPDSALQAVGLSRPKVKYLRALAEAEIDFDGLRQLSDTEVMARLTAVSGIGPWTAQIYLLSSLGRADVFPDADLALQEAAKLALGLAERPKPRDMAKIAERWAPMRAVAARLLWAYYRIEKNREGIR